MRLPSPGLSLGCNRSGGEGIETAPSPSERERVGVRVAHLFTHNPGQECLEDRAAGGLPLTIETQEVDVEVEAAA
jgi:hypothetical protein